MNCRRCGVRVGTPSSFAVQMDYGDEPLATVCESCEEALMIAIAEEYAKTHPREAREGLMRWRQERMRRHA